MTVVLQLGDFLAIPYVFPLVIGALVFSATAIAYLFYSDIATTSENDFAWGVAIGVLLFFGILPGVLAFVYYVWSRKNASGRSNSHVE